MNRRGETARDVSQPQPGLFRMRLVRRGPWVPARIVHQDGCWYAEINGDPCGVGHEDPAQAEGVFRIWHFAVAIDENEFKFRFGLRLWAEMHAPDRPEARPSEPIDLNALPSLF